MFGGLIRHFGVVREFRGGFGGDFRGFGGDLSRVSNSGANPSGGEIFIDFLGHGFGVGLGDSIAVNGACLSATKITPKGFCADISAESMRCLALENYKSGKKVHLEPAMRLNDGLHGHIVQGHVDGIGELLGVKKMPSGAEFEFVAPSDFAPFLVPKGSIAIDGVSLTIARIGDVDFSGLARSESSAKNGVKFVVAVIPATLKDTLFGEYKAGRRVNLESDIIARSVAHMLSLGKTATPKSALTWSEVDSINFRF